MGWHRYEVHGTHVCPLVGPWCESGNLRLPQKEQDWLRWTIDFGRPSRAPLESKLPPISSSLAWGLWTIFLMAQTLKNLPSIQETWVRPLGREDPPEKWMMTHSSVLAWRIAWTEEPGGLQPAGSQRVRHDWVTNTFTFMRLQAVAKLVSTSSLLILSDCLRIQDSFPNTDHCYFLPFNSITKYNLLFSCICHLSIYSLSIYHLSIISVSLYLFSISTYSSIISSDMTQRVCLKSLLIYKNFLKTASLRQNWQAINCLVSVRFGKFWHVNTPGKLSPQWR